MRGARGAATLLLEAIRERGGKRAMRSQNQISFAVAIVLGTSVVLGMPSSAKAVDENPYTTELKKIQQQMRELALEARNYKLQKSYCLPPLAPPKQPDQMMIDGFKARASALNDAYNATKQSYISFKESNTNALGRDFANDYDPTDDRFWNKTTYNQAREWMQKSVNGKAAALAAKPERNCAPPPPKPAAEVAVAAPPVIPVVAAPAYGPVDLPAVPRFCSLDEKDAWLAQLTATRFRALDNQKAAQEWSQALRRAIATGRGDQAKFRGDLAQAGADDKRFDQTYLAAEKLYVNVRDNVQVEKCGGETKKEIGALRGVSIGVEAAYGDLTIPKKPYLSLEDGGNQTLGVVDLERTNTIASLLIAIVYNLDRMPDIKIGDARIQRWMTSAEIFGYDYGVFSSGGSIDTTTEGVGIPGTGDPMAVYPAGVFLANSALNDVTGINHSHRSELDRVSLGLSQRSEYDCGASTLGVGLSYTRVETSDRLGGTVSGFSTDFEYRTDLENAIWGLFIEGGVEVPLDHSVWERAFRPGGTRSGFSLAASARGGVNFVDVDGVDRLNLSGFLNDRQAVKVGKDDATFGYQIGVSLKYVPPGAEILELSVGGRYGESDTHPVANRSGQLNERTQIELQTEEQFISTFGIRMNF